MVTMPDPVEILHASFPALARPTRPAITLTYAQTLDGSIAVRADARLVISGPETKHLTHRLRAAHDAILVGVGTVLADDPKLTARRVGGPHPKPVVLDSRLRTPPTARVLQHPRGVVIVTTQQADAQRAAALQAQGAQVLRVPPGPNGVDLPAALAALRQQGIVSLMVEGGARVLTAFLRQRLGDWLLVTIAPFLVGGVPVLAQPVAPQPNPPSDLAAFPRVARPQWQAYGRDWVVWGRLAWPKATAPEPVHGGAP